MHPRAFRYLGVTIRNLTGFHDSCFFFFFLFIRKEGKSSTQKRKLPEPAIHKYKHLTPQAHSQTALTDTDTYTRTNRLTNAETRDTDMLTHLP